MAKRVITRFIYPPIPIRTMDWIAYYDGEEETQNNGYGRTEEDAVRDLVESFPDD